MSYVRNASHAAVEGPGWYPASPRLLQSEVERYLTHANTHVAYPLPPSKRLLGIISPHSGLRYGGATAATAYRVLGEYLHRGASSSGVSRPPPRVERIFVMGPSHRKAFDGIEISAASSYETPFGPVKVDCETAQQLYAALQKEKAPVNWTSRATDESEHSLEMQLPFIAHIIHFPSFYRTVAEVPAERPDIPIVPLIVGKTDAAMQKRLVSALSPFLRSPANVFVLSSDFCHWGKRFGYTYHYERNSYPVIGDAIEAMDQHGADLLSQNDWKGWRHYLETTGNTICGRRVISLVTDFFASALPTDARRITFDCLGYSQSSRCTTLDDSSVSYASFVIFD